MNFTFIILTACLVSIDGFIGGFALALKDNLNIKTILLIGLITFILCLPFALLGNLVKNISEYVELIGIFIFFIVGLKNIFSFKKQLNKTDNIINYQNSTTTTYKTNKKNSLLDSILIGIAVGFDAAVANFSISIMGNSSVWVCVVFALMHIIFVSLALFVTKLNIIKHLKKVFWLPGAIMICISVYKLISFCL